MDHQADDRSELIQRYVDQTITDEQLSRFQEMLKNDPSIREELLLYVRMDVAIREYVLFHNYMDDSFTEQDPAVQVSSKETSRLKGLYQKIVACLFPKTTPQ